MPDQVKPKGILRNRSEVTSPPVDSGAGSASSATSSASPDAASTPSRIDASLKPFDRNAVLENTLANAKLNSVGNAIIQKNKADLEDELKSQGLTPEQAAAESERRTSNGGSSSEHLKWNEANLYLNEQEKSATMKISEPKTPFQGSVGDSEYYKPDDDDDDIPPLDGADEFMLGEAAAPDSGLDPTIQSSRIIVDEKEARASQENSEEEEEEVEETPEEKHKRFEEMRKNHYFMKGAVMHKQPLPVDDDEDE